MRANVRKAVDSQQRILDPLRAPPYVWAMSKPPVTAKVALAAVAILGALTVPFAAEAQGAASRMAQRYDFVPAIEHVQSGSPWVSIEVLSSRNDMVTGGDALVRIAHGATWDARTIRIERNGTDITTSFRYGRPGELLGLVTGLELGDNRLAVRSAPGASDVTELTITNLTYITRFTPHSAFKVCTLRLSSAVKRTPNSPPLAQARRQATSPSASTSVPCS